MGVIEFLLALAQDMILAAIPAVGFAMVFNVPVRALRWRYAGVRCLARLVMVHE